MDSFVEFVVNQIYADARRDPARVTAAPELARALIGPDSVHRISSSTKACAMSTGSGGRLVIHVPAALSPWQVNHRVSRQLAAWYLTRHGYDGGNVDCVVRCLAAAVCMPTPAVGRFRQTLGDDIARLSAHFCVSQSLAALRIAECAGYPTALRTAKKVVVRGNFWDWPASDREWNRLFRRARTTDFFIRHLSDARGRVVIRAPELGR